MTAAQAFPQNDTSLPFDRAAGIYDRTRELPEPVAAHGLPAILDLAGPRAHILEAGVGTGRIAVPLLERGADLVGVDLSVPMMARLREKFPTARLARADVARLPFPSDHFDILLTVHVMHLVGPWRPALREFRRVLRPGGAYVNARTKHMAPSVRERARDFWRGWLDAHGADWRRPGVQEAEELLHELRSMGAAPTEIEVVHFSRAYVPREELDAIAARGSSETWSIPDDLLDASVQALREWFTRETGDLNQTFEDELAFVLDVVRFE